MTKICKARLENYDEETHAATNRVRGWFRAQVTRNLHDVTDESRIEHLIDLAPNQEEIPQPTHFNAA
jgi:hypothetical protein